MLNFFNDNKLFIFVIMILIFCTVLLAIISQNAKIGLKHNWGCFHLFGYEDLHYFLAKAYRRIVTFFTVLSYFLKVLGIFTTFFVVYSLIKTKDTNVFLVLSAICDSLSLLFPFQLYINLFAECCIKMENSILKSEVYIQKTDMRNDAERCRVKEYIHTILMEAYIECENLLHVKTTYKQMVLVIT